MHPPPVKERALRLIAAGLNDCEVARRTGVARTTIRDWRAPTYMRRGPKLSACPRCWRPSKPMSFTPEDYCELLGLYLGDGSIADAARTQRLRIALDDKYPRIIEEARRLLERCFPANKVALVRGSKGKCTVVWLYSQHVSCLLPQHGRGPKHERAIRLERWQLHLTRAAPWALLKGLIRSDGCVFVNRTGPYEYVSYVFSNASHDIIKIFLAACAQVGLRPRTNRTPGRLMWNVRLNRRDDVALLTARVGSKE